MLDKLNAKKASLVAQRDQAVANLNALVGAIQCCDDLIADAVTEQIVAKAAAAEAATAVDQCEQRGCNAAPAPEMLQVIRGDDTSNDDADIDALIARVGRDR